VIAKQKGLGHAGSNWSYLEAFDALISTISPSFVEVWDVANGANAQSIPIAHDFEPVPERPAIRQLGWRFAAVHA
jgi:hypothetical protein